MADSVRVLLWNRPKPVVGVVDSEHPGSEELPRQVSETGNAFDAATVDLQASAADWNARTFASVSPTSAVPRTSTARKASSVAM
jgi:hypothetical protein